MKHLLITILFLSSCSRALPQSKPIYNLDMETLSPDKTQAVGWITYSEPAQQKTSPVKIDSITRQQGKYAFTIEKVSNESKYGIIDYPITKTFGGKTIQLRGYIKTENVNTGYAGLWLRIDSKSTYIAFDNMQEHPIKGTNDWKEYVIDLNYDSLKAVTIHAGALLVGDGKIWVDNLQLFIDGKSIETLTPIKTRLSAIERDTVFENGSGISSIPMSAQQVTNLTALGQVWGFLKYHHPAIAKGNYNWDAELFRIMPQVIKTTTNAELSTVLEKWVDILGVPPLCKDCSVSKNAAIKVQPGYGILFTNKILSPSLTKKLAYIRDNRSTGTGFYIDMKPNGNPDFLNEAPYPEMQYPDAGYRLLTLYRYWNMVQYFYPYRYLITEGWDNVLADCVPKFVSAANATDYALNTLAIIARVHDTHANIWSNNPALTTYEGKFGAPIQTKFIDGQMVVTGYYNDTLNIKQLVKPGDVIEKINGTPVNQLIKKYLPYTPASNYNTQLRDMPRMFLLRANSPNFTLGILRDGKQLDETITGIAYTTVNYGLDFNPDPKAPGYYLINKDIGYVFPGRYKNADLPAIEKAFADTKGIIVDMRCYPSDFMPFTFVPYIKADTSSFVKFTFGSLSNPGLFTFAAPVKTPSLKLYKGRVVVIVNSISQSQAEYTTMALQSSPNVTVIGSQTAGADGDVSSIILPGGISTMISGLGVYYPDGTVAQGTGVKINQVIIPTIQGIKQGRDELLDRAKAIIEGK